MGIERVGTDWSVRWVGSGYWMDGDEWMLVLVDPVQIVVDPGCIVAIFGWCFGIQRLPRIGNERRR